MHTLTSFKPNQTILATFNQHQEITYIFVCFFHCLKDSCLPMTSSLLSISRCEKKLVSK